MTFFERQQLARRQSRILLGLFAAAVAGIVFALDVVGAIVWMAWRWYEGLPVPGPATFWGKVGHVPSGIHLSICLGTLFLIFAVSALKGLELRSGGGAAVARMMGGRGIGRGTTDALERRLLNVVEEMAIASGTRLPMVFVMDKQRGINAFTAGDEVSLAAICVTRGALELLTRDELQAVVAHEFSHIVNGDMALNMRIIGVLAGIVWIGALGQFVMRGAARAQDVRALPVVLVGFVVLVIGSIGLFFSRVIKSMLARERETLADAGGVQFTRHPESLAGALDQIRASYSWVSALHAEDISHLFFANPHGFLSEVLFATHPPIEERIRAIDPRFAAEDYRKRRALVVTGLGAENATAPFDEVVSAPSIPWRLTATEAAALVGTVQAPHLESARQSLRAFMPELRSALDDTREVAGVVLALLLVRSEESVADATRALEQAGLRDLARSAGHALPLVRSVPLERQLAVVDLALPSLRIKPERERAELVRALEVALATDRKLSIYGFAFVTFVRSQLAGRKPATPPRYRTIAQMRDEAAVLISLTAHAGCAEPSTLERDFVRAFEAGAVASGLAGQVAAVRRDDCTPEAASNALQRLQELAPLDKAHLVKGLFAAITADGVMRPVEVALLRMVGGVLDCPLPPLIVPRAPAPEASSSQPLATASA